MNTNKRASNHRNAVESWKKLDWNRMELKKTSLFPRWVWWVTVFLRKCCEAGLRRSTRVKVPFLWPLHSAVFPQEAILSPAFPQVDRLHLFWGENRGRPCGLELLFSSLKFWLVCECVCTHSAESFLEVEMSSWISGTLNKGQCVWDNHI